MERTAKPDWPDAILKGAERVLVALSGLSIAAIMLVVVVDVTMRYVVSQPLGWSYDLIGSYLMVCVFFFALPDTLTHHSHIAIDIFNPRLPRWFMHLGLAVGYAFSALLVALIAWQGWLRFEGSYAAGDQISATVPWPTWPAYLMVAIGSAFFTLRCLHRTVMHIASMLTGRELADMPPPPETAAIDGEHAE